MKDENSDSGQSAEKGRQRDIFRGIYAGYGAALAMQFLSSFINLLTEDWTVPILNTLQDVIPIIYVPAVVLYFCRRKLFIPFLALAYAYDIGFHILMASYYKTPYDAPPLFLALVLFTLFFGIFYKGFRVYFRPKRETA